MCEWSRSRTTANSYSQTGSEASGGRLKWGSWSNNSNLYFEYNWEKYKTKIDIIIWYAVYV